MQRTELCFRSGLKDREFLGRGVDVAEAATGRGQGEDIRDGIAGQVNVGNKLGREVFEHHFGGYKIMDFGFSVNRGNRPLFFFALPFFNCFDSLSVLW